MNTRLLTGGLAGLYLGAMLTACGGGGGSDSATVNTPPSTPSSSTAQFAIGAGFKARVMNGSSDTFDVGGTCSGTAAITTLAAVASTFETVAGFSTTQTSTSSFSNCMPATASVTGVTYYSADYGPIGQSIGGGDYAKYESRLPPLPASVKVGDGADFGALTTYTDSTKAMLTGRKLFSYVIEPDSSTSATANIIVRTYDTTAQLLSTQRSRYRMAADGTLKLVTIEVQFGTTSNVRLVYTAR